MKNEILLEEIGKSIKRIRNSRGLSQEEFGELVNADRTYINKIENGYSNLTICKLCEICEKSNTSLKDFFSEVKFENMFFNVE